MQEMCSETVPIPHISTYGSGCHVPTICRSCARLRWENGLFPQQKAFLVHAWVAQVHACILPSSRLVDCDWLQGEIAITQRASIDSPSVEVMRCKTGAYFGEVALLTNQPRKATVRGCVPCSCVKPYALALLSLNICTEDTRVAASAGPHWRGFGPGGPALRLPHRAIASTQARGGPLPRTCAPLVFRSQQAHSPGR